MIDGVTTAKDMLAATLHICTKEELNESPDEPSRNAVAIHHEKAERRKVIKNKILAAGRISHVLSVLRSVFPLWLVAT
jgi:serine/threonine-protein phosphatase 2B catalytic subunit